MTPPQKGQLDLTQEFDILLLVRGLVFCRSRTFPLESSHVILDYIVCVRNAQLYTFFFWQGCVLHIDLLPCGMGWTTILPVNQSNQP